MVGLLSRERIFFSYLIALTGVLCSTIANQYFQSAPLISPTTWLVLVVIEPEYILLLYRTLYRPQIYLN